MNTASHRDSRLQFAARGLPCALNVVGLFLHAMGTAFKGGEGRHAVWLDLPLAVICLALLLVFAVRRGHDLGWPTGATAAGALLCTGMMPLLLVMTAVLLAMPSQPGAARFGAPPSPATPGLWRDTALLLLWPWALVWLVRTLGWL